MSPDALFQLGMGLNRDRTSQTEARYTAAHPVREDERLDFFTERDGVLCAGSHLIIDLYGAEGLDDIERIERAMRACVEAAGATLLHIHLHPFEPNGGISGVAVLAESHISIHSWPENGYAALDVFMCGDAEPKRCLPVLEGAFRPDRMEVEELYRGAKP
ncbi:MAG: adenosylmethionine decarboxylase [Geminicoccaceae bacterium]|nr:MAG: adenosylmethionine decarboxylase [Geminicoccaceae bacterium]